MDDRYFRGGMNIEIPFYGFRRLNATMPLARLRMSDKGLWLGTRTITIRRDLQSVEYDKSEVVAVFPSRGVLTIGVGIETADHKTHYFWTIHRRAVINELAERGYVIREPRRPGLWMLQGFPWPRRRSR